MVLNVLGVFRGFLIINIWVISGLVWEKYVKVKNQYGESIIR